ncbi:hypothetical protein DAETH_06700 [Deinococcus aetherius]|uniref:HTH cro/C1-type domain-containing protein n=1 Tax=Deinococcus aetherius TaxID=200252 RepID=A0ABM8AAH7_9DEIO|nr:helix-turn-helix transcriptional regulator [Deinococcus aetherius]BDP40701.1 hypothetical protein DAETH_06700 [Deinococcus aetherius]
MEIRLKFGELLNERKVTPNRLAQRHGLARNTVYALAHPEPGRVRVDLNVLAAVMAAVEAETGRPVTLGDVLELRPGIPVTPGDPRGYRDLIGLFGEEDGPGDISARHDEYLNAALEEDLRRESGPR